MGGWYWGGHSGVMPYKHRTSRAAFGSQWEDMADRSNAVALNKYITLCNRNHNLQDLFELSYALPDFCLSL